MPDKETIVYCDTSATAGDRYSNFVGVLLIGSGHLDGTLGALRMLHQRIGITETLKWSSVNGDNLRHCQQMTSALFHCIREGHVKLRLFYRANRTPLTPALEERIGGVPSQLLLRLLGQGVGFQHRSRTPSPLRLRLYFGSFPRTRPQISQFRRCFMQLQEDPKWAPLCLQVREQDISGVAQADHLFLQLLDLVLGSLNYRVNVATVAGLIGSRQAGTQPQAKRRLSFHVSTLFQQLQPGYNPRISTPNRDALMHFWTLPYRQWCYVPHILEEDGPGA